MFMCLDQALTLQMVHTYTVCQELQDHVLIHIQAITCFTQLADDSEDVPPLCNKKYSGFQLSKVEWDGVKLLHEVLKVSHHIRIPHADTELLTIDDRSRRQHSSHSLPLMTLLPGKRSLSSSFCNRHGIT